MKSIRYRRDLWQLFKRPGAAAEIGVAEGNNSRDMLEWMLRGKPAVTVLYMVDRWKCVEEQAGDAAMPQEWHDSNLAQVRAKIKPHGNRGIILRGDSDKMADEVDDESLTLLYIDGDHSYDGVFRDLRAWAPKVKPGGFVALHDYLNPNYGVRDAVRDFCGDRFKVRTIPEDKPEDAGAIFQIC